MTAVFVVRKATSRSFEYARSADLNKSNPRSRLFFLELSVGLVDYASSNEFDFWANITRLRANERVRCSLLPAVSNPPHGSPHGKDTREGLTRETQLLKQESGIELDI